MWDDYAAWGVDLENPAQITYVDIYTRDRSEYGVFDSYSTCCYHQ